MPSDKSTQSIDPQDIAAVESMRRTEDVNEYLRCGWIITAIARSQTGPDDVTVVYHLGWPRQLGDVVEPEKVLAARRSWEALMKRSTPTADGEIPF